MNDYSYKKDEKVNPFSKFASELKSTAPLSSQMLENKNSDDPESAL